MITARQNDLLAPSLALSPFTCAVNICHQPILLDLQALEIIISHLGNSDGPACWDRELPAIADRMVIERCLLMKARWSR